MTASPNELKAGDALIIVDVQNDFCPGGALPIERGDEVVPVLNDWIAAAQAGRPAHLRLPRLPPTGPHELLRERWPLASALHSGQRRRTLPFRSGSALTDAVVVTKGVRLDQDQNSAFDQTGLAADLKKQGVERVFVGGLAEDVCVLATALDGRKEGFEVVLIQDATRPVTPEGGVSARQQMRDAGVRLSP